MTIKKILLASSIFILSSSSVFGYSEVECSTDPVFTQNSCNQCFDGGNKEQGSNLGFLSDLWINNSGNDQLLYKEEQEFPTMINLGGSTWKQDPSAEGFWDYTEEFNALFSATEEGYILNTGAKIKWLESKLGYAFNLMSNTATTGTNIGLLIYPIVTHNMLNGSISPESNVHKECVLFKSGVPEVVVEEVVVANRLPETGPAKYLVLALIALLASAGIIAYRRKA